MGFKKYLVGANNLPTDFAIGGLPLFSDDIKQLETNANIWGITSILKGWSVILSGCLVDEVDTDSNTCVVTSGLVLIDDIVYEFNGYTGTYPFSITPGVQTTDERIFKDGNLKSVAIEYDYAIRTVFTTVANKPYPSDLNYNEIYFDPFCGQRATTVLSNLAKEIGETKILKYSTSTYQTSLIINRTETNKQIVGATKPSRIIGGFLRWGNIGYTASGDYTRVERFSSDLTKAGIELGITDNFQLIEVEHIPQHWHGFKNDIDMLDENLPLVATDPTPNGGQTSDVYHVNITTGSGIGGQTNSVDKLTSPNPTSDDPAFDLSPEGGQSEFSVENAYTISYSKVWNGYSDTNSDSLRSFFNPNNPLGINFI